MALEVPDSNQEHMPSGLESWIAIASYHYLHVAWMSCCSSQKCHDSKIQVVAFAVLVRGNASHPVVDAERTSRSTDIVLADASSWGDAAVLRAKRCEKNVEMVVGNLIH